MQSFPATAIFVQKPEGQTDWDAKHMHWRPSSSPQLPTDAHSHFS